MQLFNENTPPPPNVCKGMTPSFQSNTRASSISTDLYGSPVYQPLATPPNNSSEETQFFYTNLLGGNVTNDSEH